MSKLVSTAVPQHEDTTTNKLHEALPETLHAQVHVDLHHSSTPVNTADMGRKGHIFKVKSRNIMATTERASGGLMEETRLDTPRTMSGTMATRSSMIRDTRILISNAEGRHRREDKCRVEMGTDRLAREDTAMA